MRRIKVAIIGCGKISEIYIQSINEKFSVLNLVACSDIDEKRMLYIASTYQLKAMSFEEILDDSSIEMIINLTSPNAHYAISKQAIMHGKHVYSEKLMAISYEEGKELCLLADKYKVRFGAAPDTFLGGGLQTARYVLDHGLTGDILSGVISMNRDYRVFGENLPHLFKKGGSVLYDMGGYYLTAFCSMLGPVKKVVSYCQNTEEKHHVKRISSPMFDQVIEPEEPDVVTALLEFESGALVTFHLNAGTVLNETYHLELYGDKGILRMGDPNTFCGKVQLEKAKNEPVIFPFTHGFQDEARGLGAAEMAWSIIKGRPHRASKEMALHVLEIVEGILKSADTGQTYYLESNFTLPQPLPEGFIGEGFWEPEEESALV